MVCKYKQCTRLLVHSPHLLTLYIKSAHTLYYLIESLFVIHPLNPLLIGHSDGHILSAYINYIILHLTILAIL